MQNTVLQPAADRRHGCTSEHILLHQMCDPGKPGRRWGDATCFDRCGEARTIDLMGTVHAGSSVSSQRCKALRILYPTRLEHPSRQDKCFLSYAGTIRNIRTRLAASTSGRVLFRYFLPVMADLTVWFSVGAVAECEEIVSTRQNLPAWRQGAFHLE